MAESMQGLHRTCRCAEVTKEMIGKEVVLMGWVQKARDKGGIIFVDLRDRSGIMQLIFENGSIDEEGFAKAGKLRSEFVIAVTGVVEERGGAVNKNLATGEIELRVKSLRVLSEAEVPPFPIEENSKTKDEIRLKYRYLDLRRPDLQKNIMLKSKVMMITRQFFAKEGFLEIETPMLGKSTPEGARDYLVPSRVHPGKFYALPQAPQQFKQILMASGFDRYFQIAPCFRDEDARADRSPGEFYQLDMEMAFADQEDVFEILEDVLPPIFAKYGIYHEASKPPFKRIPYLEAMDKYGSDKPDLRISLIVQDATEVLAECGFGPFAGNKVKAGVAENFKGTRKQIDKMCADVEVVSGQKAYWFRLDDKGELTGGISKFVVDHKDAVVSALGLKAGDFVALSAGDLKTAQKTAGVIRKTIGASFEGYMKKDCYEFCWVVDFPMFEYSKEFDRVMAMLHPFTSPNLEAVDKMAAEPLRCRSIAYDIVYNGTELGGGSVRIHSPEVQQEVFMALGLEDEEIERKVGFMLQAFQ